MLFAVRTRQLQRQLLVILLFIGFWYLNECTTLGKNILDFSCYLIEALGLGDASLGEDFLCMVFWLLMVMY
jgi:hypothetical protein